MHTNIPPIVGLSVTCEAHIVGTSSINEPNIFWVSSIFHFFTFWIWIWGRYSLINGKFGIYSVGYYIMILYKCSFTVETSISLAQVRQLPQAAMIWSPVEILRFIYILPLIKYFVLPREDLSSKFYPNMNNLWLSNFRHV